jgi:hypothetical protein
VLKGTPLGDALDKIATLKIGGIELNPAKILDAFTGGATAAVRTAAMNLLGTVNLTPLSFLNTISSFSITPSVLSVLSGIPGIGNISGLVKGIAGVTTLGNLLSAIPGAGVLGIPLAALGSLGFTGLFSFFPSIGTEIGEKGIMWVSDRESMRHQSIIIDHTVGQEKMIFTTRAGHQMILDSTLMGRHTIIDALSGSYENFDFSTGGAKECLYLGGRIVETGCDDILTVGGDWLCMTGFPGPLLPRAPIDVLPLLDEKASLIPQRAGGAVLSGSGNILHAALISQTRWAGVDITDVATVNYTRLVGGMETIDIGAAQDVAIGGSQFIYIGSVQDIKIGGARGLDVGGAETIKVGGYRSVMVGGLLSHDVAGVYSLVAGLYATQWAFGEHHIRSATKVVLDGLALTPFTVPPVLLPVAVIDDPVLAAAAGLIPAVNVYGAVL